MVHTACSACMDHASKGVACKLIHRRQSLSCKAGPARRNQIPSMPRYVVSTQVLLALRAGHLWTIKHQFSTSLEVAFCEIIIADMWWHRWREQYMDRNLSSHIHNNCWSGRIQYRCDRSTTYSVAGILHTEIGGCRG
jgi:hypothetical protein